MKIGDTIQRKDMPEIRVKIIGQNKDDYWKVELNSLPKPYYRDEAVTIYNADCREILPLFPDKSFDLVLTDIPYGISQKSNGLRELDYGAWDKNIDIEIIFSVLGLFKPNSYYVWCADEQLSILLKWFRETGYLTRTLSWCKRNPTVINGQRLWLPSMELCAYGKLPKSYYAGGCQVGWWLDSPDKDRYHPTQKPLTLISRQLQASTQAGGFVLDTFLGSGTTAVAAKILGRKCVGIEISEKYCEIAARRCSQSVMQLEVPKTEIKQENLL